MKRKVREGFRKGLKELTAGVSQRAPRPVAGCGAITPNLNAIDEHAIDSFRDQLWLLES